MKIREEKWKSQFNEIYLELYEHLQTDEISLDQVHAVQELLGINKGQKLLDACCGQGRHLKEFLNLGIDAFGIEQSRSLVRHAVEKNNVPTERLTCSDILQLRPDGSFDFIVNLYTAFGFFDDPSNDQRALKVMFDFLKPGGKLLLETVFADREWHEHNSSIHPSGSQVTETNKFDRETNTLSQVVCIINNEKSKRYFNTNVRAFNRSSITRLFESVGFEDCYVLNGFATNNPLFGHFTPLQKESVRIACIGVKPSAEGRQS